MSYARMGHDSDVYLFGTYHKGMRVVECCGCSLETEHYFTTAVGACEHLDRHRNAGEQVPEYAYDGILADDNWLRGEERE